MKIYMAVFLLLIPQLLFAECTRYEYAELKDMAVPELQNLIDKYREESLFAMQQSIDYLNINAYRKSDQQREISRKCDIEIDRINRILDKLPK